LLAGFLSIPCAWLAVSIADNTHVPDWLRYIFSPGTMLATRLTMGPTHTLKEMLGQLKNWIIIALLTNMVFYGMLIFGFAMIFSARKRSN
jgi:EamA domain-containing membrane protein RarD